MSYTTPALLRAALGTDAATLPDDAANLLIEDTCDLIDEDLGAWRIDPATGRKIVEADVEAWQWSKLQRAATKLAAAVYSDPKVATGERWRRMKGPDFEVEDPRGSSALGGASVAALLNQSGLRRLTTTLGPRRVPSWYGFQLNVTDND